MDYTIEFLVNDEFAEWEVYGTFAETSISFDGEDGKEYRLGLSVEIFMAIMNQKIFMSTKFVLIQLLLRPISIALLMTITSPDLMYWIYLGPQTI